MSVFLCKFSAKKPPKKKRAEAERENLGKAGDDSIMQIFQKNKKRKCLNSNRNSDNKN